MKIFVFTYLCSCILAVVITPIVIAVARMLRIYDSPTARKVHANQIPRIGGVAIFLSSMLLVITVLFLDNAIGDRFRHIQTQIIALLCAATFIFLVGFVDDVRGVKVRYKLLAQIAAAGLMCLAGARIDSLNFANLFTLRFGLASFPLTILWIIGITNAVNLTDGLDGLAAGICAIACTVIAVFALVRGELVLAVVMLALMGSLSGFLFFNFNPARIFMGDCGSTFLGFILGSTSIMCASKSSALVGLALPMLALGIPIFDTLFSMLRRFLERRSIFSPDRSHFHHHLLALGLTQRQVVIVAYAVTCLFAGLGLFMMVTHSINTLILFFCILLLLLLMFRVVGSVRLRETFYGLQKKYEFASRRRQEQMNFEQVQLYFRSARTFSQWWQAVCEAAKRMDFAWISLKTKDKDGMERTEIWRPAAAQPNPSDVVIMNVPVRNHGLAEAMEFEIAILITDSLESATHQATLFSRLLDENVLIEPHSV